MKYWREAAEVTGVAGLVGSLALINPIIGLAAGSAALLFFAWFAGGGNARDS